jgi:glycosyltransferase involved in cell wall biosynthesis
LLGRPVVELFLATDDIEVASNLGVQRDHTLVLPPLSGFKRVLLGSRRVRKFMRAFDLDLVQVEAPPVPRGGGRPVLFSLHDLRSRYTSFWKDPSSGKLYDQFLLAGQLKRIDGVLTLSDWTASLISVHLDIPRDEVHVVPPIAPTAPPASTVPTSGATASLEATDFVVAVGHLEPRKNLGLLIEATRDEKWPLNVALVFAGIDQGSGQDLKNSARGSPTRIEFLGLVSEQEKWWLLRNAHIVALPSIVEGFGIVALEGSVAGTAVLVSDSSALPEVAGGTDCVLPVDNPHAWAKRIAELIDDPKGREALVARQVAHHKRNSASFVISELIEIYSRVIAIYDGKKDPESLVSWSTAELGDDGAESDIK